ncbi:MAG TPA: ThiF family adenylyltransferase [Gammaproteobacteria bacterium]|nr:ThiF family adenylyltransferase [Gammaproteobacteria bacterium]
MRLYCDVLCADPKLEGMTEDLSRYHRQMLLPGFGEGGQRRLHGSTAVVIGCGALGSLIADLLARAGVGRLVIIDRDLVELTNLQRQVLFDEQDVADAMPKAEAAKRRIARVNSQIEVTAIVDDLNHRNIEHHASAADVLVDGLDNFETRYLVNDFAVARGVPYIYGGAVGTVGAAFAVLPHTARGDMAWEAAGAATPCLRCLFEEPPPPGTMPTCDTVGVLGSAVAAVASFQVAETLKVLTGNFDRVCPTLLNVDLWNNAVVHLKVAAAYERGDCPCCKQRSFEYLEGRLGTGTTTLCGREAVQLTHKQNSATLDLGEIGARLRRHGKVAASPYMLRASITDNGKPYVLSLFPDGRAIVHGTADASVARSVYAKYVGA